MAGTSRIDFTPAHTTSDRSPGERAEVGGDVERARRAAVHPAQPAGGEHGDAGPMGQGRRGGDGGRRRCCPAPRPPRRRAPTACDGGVLAQSVQVGFAEPDVHATVQHGDGGGNRARRPHRRLDVVGDPAVVGAGQAVGQDRRLQCHHAAPGGERVGDLGVHGERAFGLDSGGAADMTVHPARSRSRARERLRAWRAGVGARRTTAVHGGWGAANCGRADGERRPRRRGKPRPRRRRTSYLRPFQAAKQRKVRRSAGAVMARWGTDVLRTLVAGRQRDQTGTSVGARTRRTTR